MVRRIDQDDVTDSIVEALQFVSYQHPPDFVRALRRAHDAEMHPPAKAAMAQILINSRLAAEGRRPLCRDTGVAQSFFRGGLRRALRAPQRRADARPAAGGRRCGATCLHRSVEPAARHDGVRCARTPRQHP